jgi:hypothetical protein
LLARLLFALLEIIEVRTICVIQSEKDENGYSKTPRILTGGYGYFYTDIRRRL